MNSLNLHSCETLEIETLTGTVNCFTISEYGNNTEITWFFDEPQHMKEQLASLMHNIESILGEM